MANLKQLLVYVNFQNAGGAPTAEELASYKNQLSTKSATDYKDRVFFIANDGSIISHGIEFGASQAIKDRIETLETKATNLETTTKALTGLDKIPADAKEVTISGDSVIGKYVTDYVEKKMTTVSAKADSAITVVGTDTPDATGHKNYEVGVTVDSKTILTADGKLVSGLKLAKKYTVVENPDTSAVFYDSKADAPGGKSAHPVILLTDTDNTPLYIVDGNEFVTDGMLDTVVYDDKEGTITFTWNSDGHKDQTVIDVKKLFNIEGIHTTTPDYIEVKQENAPFDDNGTGSDAENPAVPNKTEYHVSAKVDATDLTAFSSITHTEATKDAEEKYATNYDSDAAATIALAKVSGLVDAKKVAAKIVQIDKDIVARANESVARVKSATDDINAKIDELTKALDQEKTDRADADKKLYGAEIPVDDASTISGNADAIAKINSTETDITKEPTSVAAKIEALRKSLDSEQTYNDVNKLVSVKVAIEDGALKAQDTNNVTVKVDTLTVSTDQDGEYVLGADSASGYTKKGNFKAKDINAIAAGDPAIATVQDTWIYGQCIKSQAVNEIKSDNNNYIHLTRVANGDKMETHVEFEPWSDEIHTLDELSKIG